MKYPQFLHWSEGQFLQPHHFQQFQRSVTSAINLQTDLSIPYKEGLCSLSIEKDSLRSRRVVIKSFSAIMPDGTVLSQPGNCSVQPLALELNTQSNENEFFVYLALPYYSNDDSNLAQDKNSSFGRYVLHEQDYVDQNTGDNEATIITRKLNTRLILDPKKASDCSVLPILKLKWVSLDNKEPILAICDSYTPPYVVLEQDCNIFNMIHEFIFELRACKSKILSDIDNEGYDANLITGSGVLRLMQLQMLNVYINSLSAYLIPDKISPFTLYIQLSNFYASLCSIFPLSESKDVVYDHYDLYKVFDSLVNSIRTLISSQGKASCIEIIFNHDDSVSKLSAALEDKHIIKAKEYYLALQGGNAWKDLIEDIETGDNFRLIDKGSVQSRVRGIKLSYVRFPPRYLPMQGSDTVYFKIMRDESPRVWRYIVEDHQMVIDYANNIFSKFNAKLYLAVVDEEK